MITSSKLDDLEILFKIYKLNIFINRIKSQEYSRYSSPLLFVLYTSLWTWITTNWSRISQTPSIQSQHCSSHRKIRYINKARGKFILIKAIKIDNIWYVVYRPTSLDLRLCRMNKRYSTGMTPPSVSNLLDIKLSLMLSESVPTDSVSLRHAWPGSRGLCRYQFWYSLPSSVRIWNI